MEQAPGELPVKTVRGVFSDSALRAALFAFVLSRLLILFVALLIANLILEPPSVGPSGEIRDSKISLRKRPVSDVLTELTFGADSLWLINIARDGYEKKPFNTDMQHTWAYFPLYPLILRSAARLTGEIPLTGMAISNCFFLIALIMLYKLSRAFGYDSATADRTVFYVAMFPVSYFFSLAQTESLFLLLTISSLYAATNERWWLAGLIGALASATRLAGIFLLVPLGLLYWQRLSNDGSGNKMPGWRSRGLAILAILLVPLGLLGFMIYLKSITGNAMAFADIQVTWGHSLGFFWRPLITFLREPWLLSAGWDFRLLNFCAAVTTIACGIVLLKQRQWALGFYTLVSIIVPMSYGPLLQSLARYTLVIFPVFIVLASAGRSPRVDQIIRAVFVGLLCLMSTLLAGRITLTFA